jgi:hypothetical protein
MQKLSKYIQPHYFAEEFFNEIYQKNPNLIKNNYSLLFKSIAIGNAMSFIWLLKKVDIEPIFHKLIIFVFKKKRKLAHYRLLSKAYPQVFNKPENIKIIFNILLGFSSSSKIGKRIIKYLHELTKQHSLVDSFILDRLVNQKETHSLMIEHMKLGIVPNHINNFFAEYCKYGIPEHVHLFKKLGCDIHYLNDLALIKASEYINEAMIRYLVEKENADLRVGNYFPIFALLNEDNYTLNAISSNELISFIAEKSFTIGNIPKRILDKFLLNKRFNTAYQYFSTQKYLSTNNIVNIKKTNKI